MFAFRHKQSGLWLKGGKRVTHTGVHFDIDYTPDINQAYVAWRYPPELKKSKRWVPDEFDMVPVTVQRIVTQVS